MAEADRPISAIELIKDLNLSLSLPLFTDIVQCHEMALSDAHKFRRFDHFGATRVPKLELPGRAIISGGWSQFPEYFARSDQFK